MTTILFIHITLMSLSLVLTAGTAIAAIMTKRVDVLVRIVSIAVTFIGTTAGVLLLVQNPLDIKCAVLVSYLVAFTYVQYFATRRNQVLLTSSES